MLSWSGKSMGGTKVAQIHVFNDWYRQRLRWRARYLPSGDRYSQWSIHKAYTGHLNIELDAGGWLASFLHDGKRHPDCRLLQKETVMKSKAAIAYALNQPLEVLEVEVGSPGPREALVEIIATGVCQTDAIMLEGQNAKASFPAVLGHEGAGIVQAIGQDIEDVEVGDHVIPLFGSECRTYPNCTYGRTNLCRDIRETREKGVMPEGKIEIDALVSHVMPVEDINTAFKLMRTGESVRTILTF
jgi:hypothetical protein